jgi:hypothetical protein
MAGETALFHEPGDHRLVEPATAAAEQRHSGGEATDQPVRHDHIAEPQAGKQHLAEAAGIDRGCKPKPSKFLNSLEFNVLR